MAGAKENEARIDIDLANLAAKTKSEVKSEVKWLVGQGQEACPSVACEA